MSAPAATYSTYACAVIAAQAENPQWRLGQTCFNVLLAVRSDLAERVRGTDLDPFHKGDDVEAFLQWAHDELEVTP